MCRLSRNSGNINLLEHEGPVQACTGVALLSLSPHRTISQRCTLCTECGKFNLEPLVVNLLRGKEITAYQCVNNALICYVTSAPFSIVTLLRTSQLCELRKLTSEIYTDIYRRSLRSNEKEVG
jgi:hypothetical protein